MIFSSQKEADTYYRCLNQIQVGDLVEVFVGDAGTICKDRSNLTETVEVAAVSSDLFFQVSIYYNGKRYPINRIILASRSFTLFSRGCLSTYSSMLLDMAPFVPHFHSFRTVTADIGIAKIIKQSAIQRAAIQQSSIQTTSKPQC